MPEPTVCVKALRAPFFIAAGRLGVPLPELCARLSVASTLLTDLSARVPHGLVVRVWDTLAEQCDDPGFGLSAVALLGSPQLDLVDHVLQRSPSVRALIQGFVRYQRLYHDANDTQVFEDGDAVVVRQRFAGPLPRSRHLVEFVLALWVARLRAMLGPGRGVALRVYVSGPPAVDPARYHAVYGPDVVLSAAMDAVALPRALLDEPLPGADPAASRTFEPLLDHELAQLSGSAFPEVVRAQVTRLVREGSAEAFNLDKVARRLGVSRRTLQRRLLEDGTSFREVVDAARREVALSELGRGTATVTDLAFLLGFSQHSAFSRAFRRWTGRSPVAYVKAASG
jgi:AraC-like DNA-binding protein